MCRFCLNDYESEWIENVDEFNASIVEENKDVDYETSFENFVEISALILETFRDLPTENWQLQPWKSKQFTIQDIFELVIEHYQEHLEELKSLRA